MTQLETDVDAWLEAACKEAAAAPHPTAQAASRAQLLWLLALHHELFPALHALRQNEQGQRLARSVGQSDPLAANDAALDVEVGRWMQSLRNALGHLYELPLGWGLSQPQRDAAAWSLRLTTQLKVGLAEAPQSAAEGALGASELVDGLIRVATGLQRLGRAQATLATVGLAASQQAVVAACAAGWTAADYAALAPQLRANIAAVARACGT